MSTHPIRVLVVDDQPLFLRTMRGLLDSYSDVEVVGVAGSGEEAIESVRRLRPSVVLMDIHLRRPMDGIAATRVIAKQCPDVAVLGLSYDRKDYVVSAMQEAGAFEVLAKDNIADLLHDAIRRAVASMSDD